MASRYYIITGGTMVYVAPHFSLCAPAFGKVGEKLFVELQKAFAAQWETPPVTWRYKDAAAAGEAPEVILLRTRMAFGAGQATPQERKLYAAAGIKMLETNEDLEKMIDHLILQPETKGIILAAAICDWKPDELAVVEEKGRETDRYEALTENLVEDRAEFGKKEPRLQTRPNEGWRRHVDLRLTAADKIIGKIRKTRKDIFLVGFKATTGQSEQEQYITGLGLLKGASCNLVFANDVHEHRNMVITPEEAKYHVGKDRKAAIRGLCEMIALRSQLHFTRSTVIDGEAVPWASDAIPANLRKVVDHLIARGAYKPFKGKTVGHFATRGPKDGTIYTSRRKTDFNKLPEEGLLRIDTVGEDLVIAHGAKPSVGGQSQRIIFDQHSDVDCIVHAHVPLRPGVSSGSDTPIPVRPQRPFECGSHECGNSASEGLVITDHAHEIKAVMLDEHGPNICFSKDTDPDGVIEFIEKYWDLEAKTGGPVSLEGH